MDYSRLIGGKTFSNRTLANFKPKIAGTKITQFGEQIINNYLKMIM